MPWPTERGAAIPAGRLAGRVTRWNRKLHYYLGLFLLLFLWLFSFSGLLLNHPQWRFAEFWPNRTLSGFTRHIKPPAPGPDLSQARDLMQQLGLRGEIEWTVTRADAAKLDFRVSRPGHITEVKADLAESRATVQKIDLNAWGVIHILHTFTGARTGNPRNHRDWPLTTLWVIAMDAACLGTILMVLGSLYMWWTQPEKRRTGLLALTSGTLLCALFLAGLRWLF